MATTVNITLAGSLPMAGVTALGAGGTGAGGYNLFAASAPAYDPEILFANGEQGVWYDPSDLSTMFQDSAGTTPVTADGQPVGLILDKSGHGNHATQSTAAARPLYKTDGTYHWLQFDGVNNSLSTAAINFTVTNKLFLATGVRRTNDSPDAMVVELGTGVTVSSFYMTAPEGAGKYGIGASASNAYAQYFSAGSAPITHVVSAAIDLSSTVDVGRIGCRINSVSMSYLSSGGILGTATMFQNAALNICSRNGSSLRFNGRIYSLIVRGALSTTDEITDTETWVNGKTGAF